MSKFTHRTPTSKAYQLYLDSLRDTLSAAQSKRELLQAIVNAPFSNRLYTTQWGLAIIVLLLVNEKNNTLDRVALSDTESAKGALQMTSKKFEEIRIPLETTENILVKAVKTGKYQQTDEWKDLFVPELSDKEARFNQAGAGIATSVTYPFSARDGGTLIFSYFKLPSEIGADQHNFMHTYAKLVHKALSQ